MDREALLKLWNDAWDGDIWIAPWARAVGDLSAQQGAWKPALGRHSIWQTVNHVVFWRDYTIDKLAGRPKLTDAEIEARNFVEPVEVTESAWAAARERLGTSRRRIAGAIADPTVPLERLRYHLAHDAYHLGQIMYVRALQGLTPIT